MSTLLLISKWLDMYLPEQLSKIITSYGEDLGFISSVGNYQSFVYLLERNATLYPDALHHLSSEFRSMAKKKWLENIGEERRKKTPQGIILRRMSLFTCPIQSETWKMDTTYIRNVPEIHTFRWIIPSEYKYSYASVWTHCPLSNVEYPKSDDFKMCIPSWEQDNEMYAEICQLVVYSHSLERKDDKIHRNFSIDDWTYTM